MLTVLYAILSALLAELAFLFVHLFGSALFPLFGFSLALLLRRRLLDFPFLYGIVSGLVGIFSAFTVALFIVRKAGMWEPSAMFLGLTLPLIGEFQYFGHIFTRADRRMGLLGILHLVVRTPIKSGVYGRAISLLENAKKAEKIQGVNVEQMACEYRDWYSSRSFRGSLLGAALACILVIGWTFREAIRSQSVP